MVDVGISGINWRRGLLRLWVIASVLWCVVVFSLGILENKTASRESRVALAPCKNGASSCEPWERDWGKVGGLKPGSIVTEQGIVTQPNGGTAWEAIAAITPWAIAPPLVVLVLGASLCWAFVGFRRVSP